jgi:uncharacterized membrane protein (DUF2068 family)
MQAQREVGLRIVITYKVVKAVLELMAGLLLGWLVLQGQIDGFEHVAHALRRHVTNAAALALARWLLHFGTPHVLRLGSLALVLDGLLSAVEGWALHRRFWWAPWLVVLATSSFVPFEVSELFRHFRPIRLAILIVNLVIVLYLVLLALREHRRAKLLSRVE